MKKRTDMKRTIMMMLCLIGMAASMNAQSISGKLVDEKNEPLAYANVVLQQTDSTFVKGEVSDEKGGFRIEALKSFPLRIPSFPPRPPLSCRRTI